MAYDLIILGGGPAGAAAAVYAARKRLSTLLLLKEWGGQSSVSERVYNWIGTTSLSGAELAENLKKHVLANSGSGQTLEVREGEKITSMSRGVLDTNKGYFSVKTESGGEFEGRTILVATGSSRRKLPVKGADLFENKGLTYCASCDGPLFADMDVAVIGGGNAGFETAAQLLAYCKSVTLLNRSEIFRADEITVDKVLRDPKMKAVKNAEIQEIKGDKFVSGLSYKEKTSGEVVDLPVSGIFVEIGQVPNTSFAKDVLELDEFGRIKIDPKNQRTDVPGIWAAGDCTDTLYHQNNIASGDAVRALEDIYLYLKTK